MQFLAPKDAFLGLEKKDAATLKTAQAVVIPFGLEASVSYGGGTSKGPQAMIDCLAAAFVGVRLAFVLAYVGGRPILRTLLWNLGFFVNAAIFFMPLWARK